MLAPEGHTLPLNTSKMNEIDMAGKKRPSADAQQHYINEYRMLGYKYSSPYLRKMLMLVYKLCISTRLSCFQMAHIFRRMPSTELLLCSARTRKLNVYLQRKRYIIVFIICISRFRFYLDLDYICFGCCVVEASRHTRRKQHIQQ